MACLCTHIYERTVYNTYNTSETHQKQKTTTVSNKDDNRTNVVCDSVAYLSARCARNPDKTGSSHIVIT